MRKRLEVEYGIHVSVGRVWRLMRSMQLPKISTRNKPKRNGQCSEDQSEYKDLLKRKFKVQAPNMAWVSDITYVRVANGFNYVCTVMDLYSRKIIAWKVARNPNSILVLKTLEEAWKIRGKPEAVIFQSVKCKKLCSVILQIRKSV